MAINDNTCNSWLVLLCKTSSVILILVTTRKILTPRKKLVVEMELRINSSVLPCEKIPDKLPRKFTQNLIIFSQTSHLALLPSHQRLINMELCFITELPRLNFCFFQDLIVAKTRILFSIMLCHKKYTQTGNSKYKRIKIWPQSLTPWIGCSSFTELDTTDCKRKSTECKY